MGCRLCRLHHSSGRTANGGSSKHTTHRRRRVLDAKARSGNDWKARFCAFNTDGAFGLLVHDCAKGRSLGDKRTRPAPKPREDVNDSPSFATQQHVYSNSHDWDSSNVAKAPKLNPNPCVEFKGSYGAEVGNRNCAP